MAELIEGADYRIDRSERRIDLTPAGRAACGDACRPRSASHWGSTVVRSELVVKALTARLLFERDVHYLVRDGHVCIIDEYTGRVMPDRFWNDGLHQMIEAKEGCAPTGQRDSVARITYQRFFTRYRHLCGMSGTLAEVTRELRSVYGVGVARIPTHHPCRRRIEPTVIVPTAAAKWRAIAEHAVALSASGRPVLIGTRSVAASELASGLLRGHGVAHSLLNAAQDAAEAAIVAARGRCRSRHHRHQHGRPRHRHQAGARRVRPRRPGGDPERAARRGADRPPARRPRRAAGRPGLVHPGAVAGGCVDGSVAIQRRWVGCCWQRRVPTVGSPARCFH